MDEINLNGTTNGGNSSSDDEVVVGEDEELAENKGSVNGASCSSTSFFNGLIENSAMNGAGVLNLDTEKASLANDMGFFRFETPDNENLFGDTPILDWVGWGESADVQVGGSSLNPFEDQVNSDATRSSEPRPVVTSNSPSNGEVLTPNGSPRTVVSSGSSTGSNSSQKSPTVPSLFEEDVEFVGVELEGTEKAMEQALKEGIVGEAGPLKRNLSSKGQEKDNSEEGGPGLKEFNDANYWRVEQEVAVLE